MKFIIILLLISCISAAKIRNRPSRRPAKARFYWYPEVCQEYPDYDAFPHEEACDMYWECQSDGIAVERFCPEGEVFDYEYYVCWDEGICWWDAPEENSECPTNSNDLIFLPGDKCDNYYICINGQPTLMFCRPGMHWNMDKQYCDTPSNAKCDVGHFKNFKIFTNECI